MDNTTQPVAIVDDDTRMLESIDDLLASAGHAAKLFSSAEALIEANILQCIACLISDIGLPGMNGCELMAIVKEQAPMLPVIMITGRETQELREQCIEAGAVAVFAKPFDPQEVLRVLQRAIASPKT